MTRLASRLLASLAASFAFAMPAAATSFSTDYTDLWWNPAEDGWGANVIQQYDIIFSTLFVYDTNNAPIWYVAPNTGAVAAPAGQNTFTGPLYQVSGTFFGVPWAGRTPTQVGSITYNFTGPTTGTLSYTVNGTTVSKTISRQTWRANVLSGNYIGGTVAVGTNCAGSNNSVIIHGELTISHVNTTPTMQVDFINAQGASGRCTYSGTYSQSGRFGSITSGTFSCAINGSSNAPAGTFSLTQVESNTKGLNARYVAQDQFCSSYEGYFGGIRDVF